MRGLVFAIVLLLCFQIASSQDEFLKVYLDITNIYRRNSSILDADKIDAKDTAQIRSWKRITNKFFIDSIQPLTKRVINLTFPDINFSDVNDKAWSLSDFKDKELVLNYNYLYCLGCLNRIDSTIKRTASKNVKMIVLFLDPYKKEISDLKEYNESVMVGFINSDTRDLISLNQGDDSMYYLNKERQIEYFDKASEYDHRTGWTIFLDEHLK